MPTFEQFFSFIKNNAGRLPFVREAVALYFCAVDPDVPLWAKGLAVGAIVYLLIPTDAIPDFIPFAGWADDAGVIASAIASIGGAMNQKHFQQADQFLNS